MRFSSTEIEDNLIYLCPRCGKAEKNTPLKGVMTVEYDYKKIKKKYSKERFFKHQPGKFWLYPYLWPVNKYPDKTVLERLQLNNKPIVQFNVDGSELLFFDDTRNPTLSYKDRASSLIAIKALEFGIGEISAASTGNAGSSLAGICARLGLKSHIFVPSSIPDSKRIQIQSFGANIYLVDGSYDEAFDLCLEISSAENIYNRSTAYNPLTIEGKKSAAFDMFIQLKGKLPDYIFIPVGDGVIISGLFKGFYDQKKLGWIKKYPRLIGVQAEGSNALVRYIEKGKFEFRNASTIADSICASAPRNLYMAADAIKRSDGAAISVTDTEILDAQKNISALTGILVEPTGAATYAAYKKLIQTDKLLSKSKVLLMMTGSGLKDTNALNRWNKKPVINSISQIKELFQRK